MSTTDTTIDPREAVTEVGAAARGRVIRPGDDDYDAARAVQNGAVDRHPALIVKVADADDVARVVAIARDGGLELAIRCGGHSAAGHGTTDDGVVIDLSELKSIDIDVDGRTVWAGAGLTAGELTTAVGVHDLAIGFGDTGSVGIGGITLGGGVGYLVRKYGLTIDSLLAAEIVTADGQIRLVDAEHDPDLFWAIRGGGGNFGVVTRFRYQLHEVGTIVGGMLFLPATVDTVAGFIAAAEAAPEELSTIANVMPCPPMPFVAPEHHGELVIMAIVAYTGDVEAGERAVAPLRALATPLADLVRPMAYPEIYPPEDPTTTRPRPTGRCSSTGSIARSRPTSSSGSTASTARSASPSCAYWAGRWPGCPPMPRRSRIARAGSWSTWRPSSMARTTGRSGRRGSRRSPTTWAGRSWRLRQLRWGRGRGARPGGIPGRDVGPAPGGQAPVRSDQPVPPQPERPARGGHGGMTCRIPSHATTVTPA